ncbi:MAG: small multi-drug export protein [bacterium]|nr:small multi-drug export protein [bacterium]
MEQLFVALIAASPIAELRGAIPLGVLVYKLPFWQVFFLAIAGNMIPVLFLPSLGFIAETLSSRFSIFAKIFTWLFLRTRKRHEKMFTLLKDLSLVLFVAIPLPFTGAWTAVLVAFVFGIPFRKAFPLILFGVIMAAAIVSVLTCGITIC